MPLLGKIQEGTVQQILQLALQSPQDSVLLLDAPDHRAAVHIEDGQVVRVDHQHGQIKDAESALSSWDQGRFLLCRANTPEARAASVNYSTEIWLLDQHDERRKELHKSLEDAGYSVCILIDTSQASSLLQTNTPMLVILGEETAQQDELLLTQLDKHVSDGMKLLLLGQAEDPPPTLSSYSKSWYQYPQQVDVIATLVRQLFRKPSGTQIQPLDPAWLHILSEMTPALNPDMRIHINPTHWQELQQRDIPPRWREWLQSLDSRQPLARWLKKYPGDPRHARLSMNILLQLGVLEEQSLPESTLTDVPALKPGASTPAASTYKGTFAWLKVIVFGLRGSRREEYIQSLQQISQTQAARIPREPTVQIPYLPKTEYARVPLRQDSLLVVYGAISEASVDSIFEKIGIDLASFLFFVDTENPDEINHIRDVRQRLLARYQIPDLIMVSDPTGVQSAEIRQQLQLGPQTPVEPVRQLELKSTYKILRKLLLKSVVAPS